MPIQPTTPITIPAKNLDLMWLGHVEIIGPVPGGNVEAFLKFIPYNAAGEYDIAQTRLISIPNVMAKIQAGDALILAAYQAIIAVAAREFAASESP